MDLPETSPRWVRSRRCEAGACVEVAQLGAEIGLRDSKDPDSPVLRFEPSAWAAFVAGIRAGDFAGT